jgi:hypothetical protein
LFRRTAKAARLCLAAVYALLLSSVPAAAQQTVGRPYRGLFGGGGTNSSQVLSANAQVGAGWDSNVVGELRNPDLNTQTLLRSEDSFTLVAGGVSYADHRQRVDFGASLSSTLRNYARYSAMSSTAASVSGQWRVARRTTLTGAQTATYEPLGVLFRFPTLFDPEIGQVQAPNPDFGIMFGGYSTYATSASITQEISRRSSVTGSYSYQLADFTGPGGDYRSQSGFLRYTRGLTRNLGWRFGYGYTEAHYGRDALLYEGHSFDTGLDFNRALSITRRTHLGFSSGATGVREHTSTRYMFTGTAVLRREIGRTWSAAAGYTRNVAFFETLRIPYFYDAINLGLSGLFSRRVGFSSSAGITSGELSSFEGVQQSSKFSTGYATAGLSFALSRIVAVSAEYMLYAYSLDDVSVVTSGALAPSLSRHTAVISLRTWIPLLERGRR